MSVARASSVKSKLKQGACIQEMSEGRAILVGCLKESSSGLFENERLLFLNGNEKTISYSNQFPKELPLRSFDDIKSVKKKCLLSELIIRKNKAVLNALDFHVRRFDSTNKKTGRKEEVWTFIFETAEITNKTFQILTKEISEWLGKPLQVESSKIKNSVVGVEESNRPTATNLIQSNHLTKEDSKLFSNSVLNLASQSSNLNTSRRQVNHVTNETFQTRITNLNQIHNQALNKKQNRLEQIEEVQQNNLRERTKKTLEDSETLSDRQRGSPERKRRRTPKKRRDRSHSSDESKERRRITPQSKVQHHYYYNSPPPMLTGSVMRSASLPHQWPHIQEQPMHLHPSRSLLTVESPASPQIASIVRESSNESEQQKSTQIQRYRDSQTKQHQLPLLPSLQTKVATELSHVPMPTYQIPDRQHARGKIVTTISKTTAPLTSLEANPIYQVGSHPLPPVKLQPSIQSNESSKIHLDSSSKSKANLDIRTQLSMVLTPNHTREPLPKATKDLNKISQVINETVFHPFYTSRSNILESPLMTQRSAGVGEDEDSSRPPKKSKLSLIQLPKIQIQGEIKPSSNLWIPPKLDLSRLQKEPLREGHESSQSSLRLSKKDWDSPKQIKMGIKDGTHPPMLKQLIVDPSVIVEVDEGIPTNKPSKSYRTFDNQSQSQAPRSNRIYSNNSLRTPLPMVDHDVSDIKRKARNEDMQFPSKTSRKHTQDPLAESSQTSQTPSLSQEHPNWNKSLFLAKDTFSVINSFQQASCRVIRQIVDRFHPRPGSTDGNRSEFTDGNRPGSTNGNLSRGVTTFFEKNLEVRVFTPSPGRYDIQGVKEALEREFRNYSHLLSFMKKKGELRIPLVTLISYKGTTSLVKAMVGASKELKPTIDNELLEFCKASSLCVETLVSKGTFGMVDYNPNKVVFIDNVGDLLPEGISFETINNFYSSDQSDEGEVTLADILRFRDNQLGVFLEKMDNMEVTIVNSQDLESEFRRHATFTVNSLAEAYNRTKLPFMKDLIASYMSAQVAVDQLNNIISSEIGTVATIQAAQKSQLTSAQGFVNSLFSSGVSGQLWNSINTGVYLKYNTKIRSTEAKWGLFLGAFVSLSHLSFNLEFLDMDQQKSQHICISPYLVEGFICHPEAVPYDRFQEITVIKEIILSEHSEGGMRRLKTILDQPSVVEYLKHTHYHNSICEWLSRLVPPIPGLCNFPINPYQPPNEPPSLAICQITLSKIRWHLKYQEEQKALLLILQLEKLLRFWGFEFHPFLSDIYDLVSAFYLMTSQPLKALQISERSLLSMTQVVGIKAYSSCQKYYQVGNILASLQQHQEAVTHYQRAREILVNTGRIQSAEFGILELRIAQSSLLISRPSEAKSSANNALIIFENNLDEGFLVECFETLAQIHQKDGQKERIKANALRCSQRCNVAQDINVFKRMLRVCVPPFLEQLGEESRALLLEIVESIPFGSSEEEYLQWLERKASYENILQFLVQKLKQMPLLMRTIEQRGTLDRYKGIDMVCENREHEFVMVVQASVGVIGVDCARRILVSHQPPMGHRSQYS